MSATDMLGYWDVRPSSRQWMPKDVGMPSQLVLVTTPPPMSVRGDNTTPISNDGVA